MVVGGEPPLKASCERTGRRHHTSGAPFGHLVKTICKGSCAICDLTQGKLRLRFSNIHFRYAK